MINYNEGLFPYKNAANYNDKVPPISPERREPGGGESMTVPGDRDWEKCYT